MLATGSAPRREEKAARLRLPGPPPRECFGSEAEVQLPDGVDDVLVAARRAAGEALEERQHGVRRVIEVDERVSAFEVSLLRLGRPLPVLELDAPLAAPGTVDLDAVGELLALGDVLVDCVHPEDERERQDQSGRRLID